MKRSPVRGGGRGVGPRGRGSHVTCEPTWEGGRMGEKRREGDWENTVLTFPLCTAILGGRENGRTLY